MIELMPPVLEYFARSGGGGSSSSGGGGDVVALIGYLPSYYIGKFVKKLLPRKAELIVSASTATLVSCLLLWLAFVWHGGYLFMFLIVVGIWAGWGAAFFDAWDKIKVKSKRANEKLAVAAQSDQAWNKDALVNAVRIMFFQYQADWTNFSVGSIRTYATKRYGDHAVLLLMALRELQRQNVMTDITILETEVIDVTDDVDNSKDSFQVAIKARANDSLIDKSQTEDRILFTDKNEFIEYWTFFRDGSSWKIDRIDQATASFTAQNVSIEKFANEKGLHYSLDMGWLFLPSKGVLFSGGTFGKSDINNHTIGLYNDHLIQLYTYSHMPGFASYVVAQISLPKSYDGIYVRQKASSFWTTTGAPKQPPSSYQKYNLEWGDFNNRYEVYATHPDRIALFELLNPAFMTYLYDKDPKVCIEVTDNIVYLYKSADVPKEKVSIAEYEKMFVILEKAYKELER